MVLPVNKGDSCPEDKVCSIGSPFLSPRFLAFFVDPFCEAQTSGFLPIPSLSFPVFLSFLFAKTISCCFSSLSRSRVIQQPGFLLLFHCPSAKLTLPLDVLAVRRAPAWCVGASVHWEPGLLLLPEQPLVLSEDFSVVVGSSFRKVGKDSVFLSC